MNTYETEEDQVKALKQWWADNGRAVILGLVVGIGGIVGWQYMENQRVSDALAASKLYSSLVESMQDNAYDQALATAQAIQSDYPDTPYGDLAVLQQAQALAAKQDRAAARQALLDLAQRSHNEAIKQLALLRAYRLQLAEGDAQAVVDQLETIEAGQFYGQFQELKGDALVSLGQLSPARSAYLSALESVTVDQRLLRLKLADLGVTAQSGMPQ